ncbi:hypothetical protein PCC7424_1937 [Gloeothece citriformis PCC 7424]|uniref:Uncharacterized protein n=1 Tax=Gloeothece citriformis (strain PCC 7424) TaxID=65393 RepID=B7KDR6_GLOC7|nr:DUF1097 domain-containing protein [Gloeothece citriformis]ACK70368.1 hypothetical protein PCC7424_1937 [Gloeothece citriformis PCC 7424]
MVLIKPYPNQEPLKTEGALTQESQINYSDDNQLFYSDWGEKLKTMYPKIILGFLMGICISLIAIILLTYYSPLIATLAGGGIGATLVGLGGAILMINPKTEENQQNLTNNLEENDHSFLSWIYPQEIEPKLRKTYLILIGLLLICFLIALIIHSSNNWLQDFSLDIASEIIGILLVIFAVDRVIDAEREKKDKKKERVAMQQIKQPILEHFSVLMETFNKIKTECNNSNLEDLSNIFDRLNNQELSDFSGSLKNQDHLLYSIENDNIDWLDYLSQECRTTQESLNRTVEKYSLFLQPRLLRTIEEFVNSPFLRLIVDYQDKLKSVDKLDKFTQNYQDLFENPDFILLLKQHLIKFFKLIKLFNKNID